MLLSDRLHAPDHLAARLLRLTPGKLATLLADFGHVLETFVVKRSASRVSWLVEPVTPGHWRTSDGAEIDLVV